MDEPRGPASRTRAPQVQRRRGQKAEALVERHLVACGYELLARNHCIRGGEVDLVLTQGETVVFVEVKRRREGALVGALESVTITKQRRIVRAALDFALRHGLTERSMRFDVVAVTDHPDAPPSFDHVEAAFDASVDER